MHPNIAGVARFILAAILSLPAFVACAPRESSPSGAIETAYQDARYYKDQIDVTRARGAQGKG